MAFSVTPHLPQEQAHKKQRKYVLFADETVEADVSCCAAHDVPCNLIMFACM